MKKLKKTHHRMFENIYDIICKTTFEDEARKELKKFIKNKEYEWDGDHNIISIGKRFKIQLCQNK